MRGPQFTIHSLFAPGSIRSLESGYTVGDVALLDQTLSLPGASRIGTGAELFGYIDTSAKLCYGHFGTKEDASATGNSEQY